MIVVEYSEASIGSVPPAAPIDRVPLIEPAEVVGADVVNEVEVSEVIVVPAGNPPPLTVSPTANPAVVAVTMLPDIAAAARALLITALFNVPFASTITQPAAPGVVVKVKPVKLDAVCIAVVVRPVTVEGLIEALPAAIGEALVAPMPAKPPLTVVFQ